ncbi:MAG: hypothetical protein HKN04_15685 [Rhodothermaceae bacterium]|nr:hypothetical protein [Rhodothermaceae bacterium]
MFEPLDDGTPCGEAPTACERKVCASGMCNTLRLEGGLDQDTTTLRAVAVNPDDGAVAVGRASVSQEGASDARSARIGPLGQLVSGETVPRPGTQEAYDIASGPGGEFIVGASECRAWVRSLPGEAPDGIEHLFGDSTCSTTQVLNSVIALPGSALVVGGRRQGGLALGGGHALTLRQVEPDGSLPFEVIEDGAVLDGIEAVAAAPEAGGYAAAGGFGAEAWIRRTDPVGGTLWTRTYGDEARARALDVDFLADGRLMFTGYSQVRPASASRPYAGLVGTAGDLLWGVVMSVESRGTTSSLAVAPGSGKAIAVGWSEVGGSESRVLVAPVQLDDGGHANTWVADVGPSRANDIEPLPGGGFIVVGASGGQGAWWYFDDTGAPCEQPTSP